MGGPDWEEVKEIYAEASFLESDGCEAAVGRACLVHSISWHKGPGQSLWRGSEDVPFHPIKDHEVWTERWTRLTAVFPCGDMALGGSVTVGENIMQT